MSDRLLKVHKGKWTRHIGGIRKRHQSSLQLNSDKCSCIVENELYTVVGSNDITYTVRQNDALPHQPPTCPLTCLECNACVHSFSCTCLDSGLHNTICKHIHLVIQIYNPVRHNTTDHDSNQQDAVNHVHENSEGQYAEESDHNEGTSVVSPVFPDVCESDAIMSEVSSRRPSRNINQLISNTEVAWANIRTAMEDNPVAAQVAWEHMSRLRSLLAALGHEPQTPRLPPAPPSKEPVNKLATTQRSFRSTRKHKATKREMTASKPSMEEMEFLLRALGGNELVISHLPSMDQNSSYNLEAHVINFEHSYTRP